MNLISTLETNQALNESAENEQGGEQQKEARGEVYQRHTEERAELARKFERNKSFIPRKDRAGRARLAEEYANEGKALQERQLLELNSLGYSDENTKEAEAGSKSSTLLSALSGLSIETNGPGNAGAARKESRAARRRRLRAEQEAASAQRVEEERAQMGPGEREIEMEAMKQQLLGQNLRVHQIAADGHCLYNAVAHQMKLSGQKFDVQPSSSDLRSAVAEHMIANASEFEPFIEGVDGDGDKFISYCEELRSTAIWGGQVELRALAECLGVAIEVFAVDMPILRMGNSDAPEGIPVFKVSYHRKYFGLGEHYNSIVSETSTV